MQQISHSFNHIWNRSPFLKKIHSCMFQKCWILLNKPNHLCQLIFLNKFWKIQRDNTYIFPKKKKKNVSARKAFFQKELYDLHLRNYLKKKKKKKWIQFSWFWVYDWITLEECTIPWLFSFFSLIGEGGHIVTDTGDCDCLIHILLI